MSTDHLLKNQRMRPGVKALIVHDGKILMVHENLKRNGINIELIDFPGGGMDFGESLENALIREVKEEVGLDIKVGKTVGAWDFVLKSKDGDDSDGGGVHIVCIGCQCEVIGSAKIDTTNNPAQEDIFDAKWYSKEELLADDGKILRRKNMIKAVGNLDI